MKKNSTLPAETAAAEEITTAAAAAIVVVRVRVLKNGLSIAGGVAAKNAVVNAAEAAAKFHEERGEVQILGTL